MSSFQGLVTCKLNYSLSQVVRAMMIARSTKAVIIFLVVLSTNFTIVYSINTEIVVMIMLIIIFIIINRLSSMIILDALGY